MSKSFYKNAIFLIFYFFLSVISVKYALVFFFVFSFVFFSAFFFVKQVFVLYRVDLRIFFLSTFSLQVVFFSRISSSYEPCFLLTEFYTFLIFILFVFLLSACHLSVAMLIAIAKIILFSLWQVFEKFALKFYNHINFLRVKLRVHIVE